MAIRNLLLGLLGCVGASWAQGGYCVPSFQDVNPGGLGGLDPYSWLATTDILSKIIFHGSYGIDFEYIQNDDGTVDQELNGVKIATLTPQAANVAVYNLCGPVGIFQGSFQGAVSGKEISRTTLSTQIPLAGQANLYVAVADFNGDGVPDSATLTSTGITVTLYNSNQTILSTATYPVAGIGPSIVAVDFNGDGYVDLAVTENDPSGQGNVVVLLGNGSGAFGPAAKFPAGPGYAFYLATGFFNSDNAPDLAVTNSPVQGAGSVSMLLGNGKGTFGAPVSYTVGPAPATIVAADFDGNGKLDLAALDAEVGIVNKVWVLLGNGDGTFQTAKSTASGTGSGYLAFADLNHDGKQDLVIADQFASAMAVMMGNGDGTFQASNEYLIGAEPVSIGLLPLGDGTTLISTGDNASGSVVSYLSRSTGIITSPQLQHLGVGPAAVAAANLNAAGQPDLVITDAAAGNVYVMLATGNGQFGNPATISLGSQPGALVMADVNGDNNADAIVADVNGLDVLLGNGNGTFQPVKTFAAGGTLSSVTVADFNLDQKPDVAAANAATGGISLFVGNGGGTFQTAKTISLASGLVALSAVSGDFNGDSKPDLVVAYSPTDSTQPGGIAVLLGNGNGTFQAPVYIALPGPLVQEAVGNATSAPLAVADLNGDRILDVVTAIEGPNSDQVVVLLGNVGGTFQAPILVNTNTTPPMIVITDINGDGKPDLVLASCCGLTEASYMIGNGNGTFQAEVQFPSGPNPGWIAAADLTGLGATDLAVIGQVQLPVQGTFSILASGFPRLSIAPSAVTLTPSQAQQYAVTGYFGTSTAVNWSFSPPVGTISASGLYRAPASITTQQAVTVTATSASNANYLAGAGITLSPPPTQYQLTIAASPAAGGTVTPSSGAAFAAGTVEPITAAANSGYQFSGWTGPVANANSASTTVTMNGPETVTANFTSVSGHPAFFSGEDNLGSGVYYLAFPDGNLFGYYAYTGGGWIDHFDMGYEYVDPGAGTNVYFWDLSTGHWWYTSASEFPYLYDFTLNAWLYYYPNPQSAGHYSANPRYFVNLATNVIFTM